MPRNVERDAIAEEKRRLHLVEEGFRLFSEKGIENVSLQAVADAADVGIATLYKYYQNKVNLLVAISAYIWENVWLQTLDRVGAGNFDNMTAYQGVELYIDCILDLYRNRKDVLRFSGNYKTYICREVISKDILKEHLKALEPVDNLFHKMYEKAKKDHTIRTDVPGKELYTTITLTILGMAERYAQGLVWAMNDDREYINELLNLKSMMLMWIKGDGIE